MATASPTAGAASGRPTVELEVVLVRAHASEPWGLQLEYQLYRGAARVENRVDQWGCFAVVDTRPESPAARDPALKIGDMIVGVDGKRVSAAKRDDFAELLSILHSKGRAVQLTVARHAADTGAAVVFEGEDEGVTLKVSTFENHETRMDYHVARPPEATPADDETDERKTVVVESGSDEARDDALAWCVAYRLKFVPLDDETCRGARFAGLIPRVDGQPRLGYDKLAEGDVLVSIDEDCVVDLEYAQILAHLRRQPPIKLCFAHTAPLLGTDDAESLPLEPGVTRDPPKPKLSVSGLVSRMLSP